MKENILISKETKKINKQKTKKIKKTLHAEKKINIKYKKLKE